MKKKVLSIVLVLTLLLPFTFAGCSSKKPSNSSSSNSASSSSAASVEDLKGTLTLWIRKGEGTGAKPGDPFYDYIHAKFPNLVLNITEDKGWGDITKGLASGDLPDIYFWEGNIPSILQQLNQNGYAEPLDSYLSKDSQFKNSFSSDLLEKMKVDGVTYGLPFDTMPVAILANLDLFDKANVQYPTNDWTIDDFVDICKKLTNKSDSKNARVALARNIDVEDYPRLLNIFLQAYGVKGYKLVDNKKVSNLAEDPNAIKAVQKYLEVYGNNYACTLSDAEEKAMGLDTTIWDVGWEKGVAAMFAASTWAVQYDQQAKKFPFKQAVYNVPKGPNGRGTYVDIIGYSVYKGSKNKDLAVSYLKFMTSQEFRENAYTKDTNTGDKIFPFKYDQNRYSFSYVMGDQIFGFGGLPFAKSYDLNSTFKELNNGFAEAGNNSGITPVDKSILKMTQDVNKGTKQLVDALKEYDNYVNANKILDQPPQY